MKKNSRECPKGQIKRSSYTRKLKRGSKVHVPSGCIKAQSQSGEKTTTMTKRILAKEARIHKMARQKYGTPKCAKGEIVREGYLKRPSSRSSKKSKQWIKPTCIKKRGKKGSKGKKLFVLKKGELSQFGYHNVHDLSMAERHKALREAIQHEKPLSVYRKLVALSTLSRNTDPALSRTFKADSDWIKTTREYRER